MEAIESFIAQRMTKMILLGGRLFKTWSLIKERTDGPRPQRL